MKVRKQLTSQSKLARTPFFKRKPVKIGFLILAFLFLVLFSFLAYIYAQGSRIFDDGSGKSFLFRNLKSTLSEAPDLKGESDDRINIVFTGLGGSNHPGGQLTDSIMIVSIRPKEQDLAMLSVPRDLYVPVADHNTKVKLNEVYALAEKERKGTGPDLLKKTLGNILGVQIHYYVSIDFRGFEKIVDQLGGVDVTVDKALYDPYYPDERMQGYEPFYIKAGQQHLNGATALKYARSRETSSDFDRSARQQKIFMAVKEKVLSMGFLANPKKIMDLSTTIGDHLKTDITPAEIKSFAELLKKIEKDKMTSKVLSDETGGPLFADSSSGTYYLLPRGGDFTLVQDVAKNIFDKTNEEKSDIDLEVINGSNVSGTGARVSNILKNYGYQVISIKAAEKETDKTVIYDYSEGKYSATIEFLENKFNATSVEKTPSSSETADISIVIGSDYTEISKK